MSTRARLCLVALAVVGGFVSGCGGSSGAAGLAATVPAQYQAVVSSQAFQNIYSRGVTATGVALFGDGNGHTYTFSEADGLVDVTSNYGNVLAQYEDSNAPTLLGGTDGIYARYYSGNTWEFALDGGGNKIQGWVVGFDGTDPIVRKGDFTYYSKNRTWPAFATHDGSPAPRPGAAIFGKDVTVGVVQYPWSSGFGFGFYSSVAAWDKNGNLTEMGKWDGNQAESTVSRVMDDGRILGEIAGTLGRATVLWSMGGDTEILWQSDWYGHMTGSQSNGLIVGDDTTIAGRGFVYTKGTGKVALVGRTTGLPAGTTGQTCWPLAVSRSGWVFGYVNDSSMSPGHARPTLLKPVN